MSLLDDPGGMTALAVATLWGVIRAVSGTRNGVSDSTSWITDRLPLIEKIGNAYSMRRQQRPRRGSRGWSPWHRRDRKGFDHPYLRLSTEEFGLKVRSIRLSAGQTQKAVAKRTSLSSDTLGRIERGHRTSSDYERVEILKALDQAPTCNTCPYQCHLLQSGTIIPFPSKPPAKRCPPHR